MRFVFFLLLLSQVAFAQFAPPAGQAGSTAISKDTAIISGWATSCTINRGLRQINLPDSGYASVGDGAAAIGPAGDNGVVSLGDGGKATLQFAQPISDGEGFDFCVFENSFQDDFLELAFVEVSSDGIHFVRFPATSLIQDTLQTASFGLTDATKIDGLAGKYRVNFGTPFDLELLKDSSAIDIHSITHVRIVDVVGSVDSEYATFDSYHHKINDPWPTNFPSSGFDLDAVAVLAHWPASVSELNDQLKGPFPNPFCENISIPSYVSLIEICDALGRTIPFSNPHSICTSHWQSGVYFFKIEASGASKVFSLVKE